MDLTTLLLFILGLVLLIGGAEALVRGASGIAGAFGMSPLAIGLTVVAYGTSSPELAVSMMSAGSGQGDIAIGNVVGSNIFNVLFILGLSALITPLTVAQRLIWTEVPIMIGASLLLVALSSDGHITFAEGFILTLGAIAYTIFTLRFGGGESTAVEAEYAAEVGEPPGTGRSVILVVIGLAALVLGSRWLVDGAVMMARSFGMSDLIIGLTIVAAGTSMPEVATSIIASLRGERDIAVGNVVGSNIFNILGVGGLSALVTPTPLPIAPEALTLDIPIMLATAVVCSPIFFTGHTIQRWEGALFLLFYAGYTTKLVLAAGQHAAHDDYTQFVATYVLPVAAVTVLASLADAIRRNRQIPSTKFS